MIRTNLKLIILLSSLLTSFYAYSNDNSLIWFAPNHYEFLQQGRNVDLLKEYKVDVFQFYSGYILNESNQNINKIFKYLKNRGIAISVELPVLVWTDDYGNKLEGFGPENYVSSVLNKIKRNGGEVDYVVMDEPIMAMVKEKKRALIKKDVKNLVLKLQDNINTIYSIYPNVLVGDVEPINQLGNDNLSIINVFSEEFKSNLHHKLDFMHLDISWGIPWQKDVKNFITFSKINFLKNGVIFNSQNTKGPDESWLFNARQNLLSYKKAIAVKPDHMIVQSWSKYPMKIIPDPQHEGHLSIIKNLPK